jgi:hypothetical protein
MPHAHDSEIEHATAPDRGRRIAARLTAADVREEEL